MNITDKDVLIPYWSIKHTTKNNEIEIDVYVYLKR